MNAVVFIGPTLTETQAREHLDARYLAPAQQGDIYLAAIRHKPHAIGLIDGRFDQVDAVAHKEILWAMAQGIHVYGAASMGALRAAELHMFGMVGVGTIFTQYHNTLLIDDDEVAVSHATAEHDHRALSTAMVDIRATLAAAACLGHITKTTYERLITLAKQAFYPDRSYPALLHQAADSGVPAAELCALRSYLKDGRIHRKQLDARAMLDVMRKQLEGAIEPKQVAYTFSHTDAWEAVRERAENRAQITQR